MDYDLRWLSKGKNDLTSLIVQVMGGRGLSGKLNTDCHFWLVCFIYLSLFILSRSSLVE